MMQPIIAMKGERLYLDSCVIIAYFSRRHHFHRKAKDILSKIENDKFVGVISFLSLMEFMKILRQALVKSGLGSMDDVENTIKEHLKVLFVLDNIRFVEGRPPELEPIPEIKSAFFYTISCDSFRILSKYRGCIKIDEKQTPTHDGLSPSDAIHIALAKHLGCDKLVTTDWDFKECQDEITPLVLGDRNSIW